jgi:hypothetical protein
MDIYQVVSNSVVVHVLVDAAVDVVVDSAVFSVAVAVVVPVATVVVVLSYFGGCCCCCSCCCCCCFVGHFVVQLHAVAIVDAIWLFMLMLLVCWMLSLLLKPTVIF